MTQMESPKRKMQKKNDYQRHKLFRKIKRRRKAQAEAEQHMAEKQLRRKLKIPKFGSGKTREVYTSDIHFNNDDTAGGIDRYGNKFDYIQLPETVVTARKIPTFKDIEKQIGRKITQDEIDKVIAVDPQVPIEVSQPVEKGMYNPSITNELANTIVGTAGDAVNYLANKAGLPNLAPNEQLVETRDGDALFDIPIYSQVLKYTPRVLRYTPRALRNMYNKTLGNLGSAAIYANGLGFDGTVGKSFFRDPNKAYRITEFPEVEGIREAGMNVTTRDAASKVSVPANNWRLSAFNNYSHSKDGSWYKLPQSISQYEEENPLLFTDIGNMSSPQDIRLATKTGSAHGNRSQASLGKPWEGGLSTSGGLFPRGILEIQGGNKIAVGKDRVHFSLKDWNDALIGSRVGYKTGEMPLDNLTWYQRLPNGRYTMGEPVLPDKTIQIKPSAKQQRLQLEKPTWQIYHGKTHKISEVIDDSGNVNLANLFKIQNEALSNIPGGRLARHRLENPDWHKTDWNTFLHSRDAYQRALQAGYPDEALFPTLMHDVGKLWAGDGHGPYGASIVKQIFPDATNEQIMAIYQHMDKVPESAMGKLVKGADIAEDNPFRNYSSGKDIHIKKSKRGTFTKAAKQHSMSVQGFANRVLRNPSKYSAAMRKKANFARNASKWNK